MASSGVNFYSLQIDYIQQLNNLVSWSDTWATEIETARSGQGSLSARLSSIDHTAEITAARAGETDLAARITSIDHTAEITAARAGETDLAARLAAITGAAIGAITDAQVGTATAGQLIAINPGGTGVIGIDGIDAADIEAGALSGLIRASAGSLVSASTAVDMGSGAGMDSLALGWYQGQNWAGSAWGPGNAIIMDGDRAQVAFPSAGGVYLRTWNVTWTPWQVVGEPPVVPYESINDGDTIQPGVVAMVTMDAPFSLLLPLSAQENDRIIIRRAGADTFQNANLTIGGPMIHIDGTADTELIIDAAISEIGFYFDGENWVWS